VLFYDKPQLDSDEFVAITWYLHFSLQFIMIFLGLEAALRGPNVICDAKNRRKQQPLNHGDMFYRY